MELCVQPPRPRVTVAAAVAGAPARGHPEAYPDSPPGPEGLELSLEGTRYHDTVHDSARVKLGVLVKIT